MPLTLPSHQRYMGYKHATPIVSTPCAVGIGTDLNASKLENKSRPIPAQKTVLNCASVAALDMLDQLVG